MYEPVREVCFSVSNDRFFFLFHFDVRSSKYYSHNCSTVLTCRCFLQIVWCACDTHEYAFTVCLISVNTWDPGRFVQEVGGRGMSPKQS